MLLCGCDLRPAAAHVSLLEMEIWVPLRPDESVLLGMWLRRLR